MFWMSRSVGWCKPSKRKSVAYCTTFLFLFIALPSGALNIDGHKSVTQKSLQFYLQNCTWNANINSHFDDVVKAVVAEDDVTLSRAFNWHFYNPEKDLGKILFFISREPEQKLQKALKIMTESDSDGEAYMSAFGVFLHHLQDTANPAHGVPYMHGFHYEKDAFDEYSLPLDIVFAMKGICQQAQAIALEFQTNMSEGRTVYDLNYLLYRSYHETKRSITSSLSVSTFKGESDHVLPTVGLTWEEFWTPCFGEGFCLYKESRFGNNFGKTEFYSCNDVVDECGGVKRYWVEIPKTEYDRFATERAFQAVIYTIATAIILDDLKGN